MLKQDDKALFSVIDNCRMSYYSSVQPHGFSFPLYVVRSALNIKSILESADETKDISFSDILPLIKSDPRVSGQKRTQALKPLPEINSWKKLSTFAQNNSIDNIITIDFDNSIIRYINWYGIYGSRISTAELNYSDESVSQFLDSFTDDVNADEDRLYKYLAARDVDSRSYDMTVTFELNGKTFKAGLPYTPEVCKAAMLSLGTNDLTQCEIHIETYSHYLSGLDDIPINDLTYFDDTIGMIDDIVGVDTTMMRKFAAAIQAYEPETWVDINRILTYFDEIGLVTDVAEEDAGNAIKTDYGYIESKTGFSLEKAPVMQM